MHKLSAIYWLLLDSNHHPAISPDHSCLLHGLSAICCILTRTKGSCATHLIQKSKTLAIESNPTIRTEILTESWIRLLRWPPVRHRRERHVGRRDRRRRRPRHDAVVIAQRILDSVVIEFSEKFRITLTDFNVSLKLPFINFHDYSKGDDV